ncbi:hypothetical protein [Desulfobulbus elongatus]|uniref:hypothetical protein n=1 Tax=Desulfobulbus elongatus TaxID=53332 RepID=UPI00047FF98C|nr:hypothetical protein [Desulfobulbus elongatus]
MLYIERDAQGAIAAIRRGGEKEPGREPASLLDAEVLAFLKAGGELETLTHLLMSSDASMVRVLEDLIDLLIAKKLILITELPPEAREKILSRKQIRAQMAGDQLMVDDIL